MKINQGIVIRDSGYVILCHNDVIMGSNWENGVIMNELNAKHFYGTFLRRAEAKYEWVNE